MNQPGCANSAAYLESNTSYQALSYGVSDHHRPSEGLLGQMNAYAMGREHM